MAQLLGWHGTSTQECTSVSLTTQQDIEYFYAIDQGGSSAKLGTPFLAGIGSGDITDIECGVSSFVVVVNPISPTGYVSSELTSDQGRISLLFPESIAISDLTGEFDPANGNFKMTTFFKNDKPTYKNENGWWIWWNGTDWSLTDSIQNPTKTLKNGDSNPKGGVWDCDPSCQQGGRGPESPPPSCIPTTDYISIPHHTGTQPVNGIGNVVFGVVGTFGFNPVDFPSTEGFPRTYMIKLSGETAPAVFITASNFPATGTEPMVYFEKEDGSCYEGNLQPVSGTDNWEVTLSLR